ncbi:MAG TPA: hypothetical protein DEG17_14180 [Cyanobacteria bacterium UBA11149]|nr:hypothetical protein [Cyanobacteria bacterium UBA11367]HBE59369.1 hypothetical protein [Cyanobacteria bacterium UBA11366]HBR75389.1 hypothetical protein [Cyanobacteria bacterium UBA11159]HBS70792.1 hypothetical protein [Cyanobacteria bacterium UBA11153]HBW89986.1 hypothetical protein [Cyanobacteria bacterium UBA11149]HCA95694.1 hypothetical protein [Cyanobacteria bacterium UBA9226]
MLGLLTADKIVQELEAHPNASRIKKLMVYACQNSWENDPNILHNYRLADLIQKLRSSHSTIEELAATLHRQVQTLNRQAEYLLVSEIVINQLGQLYQELEEVTQVVFIKPENLVTTSNTLSVFDDIAKEIEQDSHGIRMKKLIIYVCKNRWENDQNILDKFNLCELIREINQANPTLDELSAAFAKQVQTLNRHVEYTVVAQTIISKLEKLYRDSGESTGIKINKQAEYNQSLASRQDIKHQPISEGNQIKQIDDRFEVRMEIMKYTNPLRAKLLLFSVIYHPFKGRGQDWTILRSETLDDLVLKLFSTCPTFPELESKLYHTAKGIANPDESTQAASAIARSLKPFYTG